MSLNRFHLSPIRQAGSAIKPLQVTLPLAGSKFLLP